MAATNRDVSFDMSGREAWRTQDPYEALKRKAISCLTASVNVVSFLSVLIMLSPFTMDITCYRLSFGGRAWLNFNVTLRADKTNGQSVNLHTCGHEKRRPLKYSYPRRDQPKSEQQLAYAVTWNQLAWWCYLNGIKSNGVRWSTLAERLSWLMGFLINRPCCCGR